MRLAYKNEWDNYDIFSVTDENSNHPANNTQNQILTTTWRSDDIAAAKRIVIDAGIGNTITANCIFISGHNLTNAAIIKFEMHTDDAWGMPDISEPITWREGHIYKYFTSASKQFISFYFDDATNPDGYIEIGRLFAGVYLQISPSSNLPLKIQNYRNDIVTITDMGNLYGTPGISRRRFPLDFSISSDTMIENIRAIYDEVGKYKAFYFMNYDELFTHHDIAYVHINNDLEEIALGAKRNTYTLELEEVT